MKPTLLASFALLASACGARAAAPPPVVAVAAPAESEWIDYGPTRCSPEPPSTPAIDAPWVAPDGLDPELAEWLEANVVGTGLDPRGLEYRAVRMASEDIWNPSNARGFVRDLGGGVPLVLVGGEWWPALAVGPPIDLAGECEQRLDRRDPRMEHCRGPQVVVALAAEGRRALAARVAAADFGVSWLVGPSYVRARTAHAMGDDCFALREIRGVVASRAEREDLAVPLIDPSFALALLADQERRAAAPRRPPISIERHGPTPPDQIARLIDALEDEPLGAPTAPQPSDALIRAGEGAIPALLDVIEHDQRLSRKVSGRSADSWVVMPVWLLAWDIVDRFLDLPAHGFDPRATAIAARERWSAWLGLPTELRALRLLENERGHPVTWAEGAELLIASSAPDAHASWSRAVEPVLGEPMRAEHGARISALLVDRADASLFVDTDAVCTLLRVAFVWGAAQEDPAAMRRLASDCSAQRCVCVEALRDALSQLP